MGIKADMAAVLPGMFEIIGEEATFTPSGGLPVNCHIDITEEVDYQPDGFSTCAWQRSKVIEVTLAEIGVEPNRGDIFSCGGRSYTVEKVHELSTNGLTIKMAVTP